MLRRFVRSEAFPLLILVAVNLAIGLLTFRQYGESFDEDSVYQYAGHSLDVYAGAFREGFVSMPGDEVMDLYGPFYFMTASLGSRLVGFLSPGHPVTDAWHLVYFITFQVGLIIFYFLARRWLKPWAAFGATLLLGFQPLFWGHAFINPKDLPFMVFFMASVLAGLRMVDTLPAEETASVPRHPASTRSKRILLLLAMLWVTLILGMVLVYRTLPNPTELRALAALAILTGLGLLIAAAVLYFNLGWQSLRSAGRLFRNPWVWLAGILLGLTIPFRVTGILAGVLVAIHAWYTLKRPAWAILVVYAVIAAVTTYLAWPWLWEAPLANFAGAVLYMSRFPLNIPILFNGQFYAANALPFNYLPVLMGLQLTEPVLILFLAGCGLAVWSLRSGRQKDLLLLAAAWFLVPLVALMVLRPATYDNFRQLFFLLPPVFLLAGVALQTLFERLRFPVWRVLFIAACLLPGIYAGAHLHPYEYTYYNSLVGGLPGAAGRFETDYWASAYRQAAEYLDRTIPPDAKIIAWGNTGAFTRFARPDLQVTRFQSANPPVGEYDYAILTTRVNADQTWFPEAPVVYRVQVEGVTLAVIKRIH